MKGLNDPRRTAAWPSRGCDDVTRAVPCNNLAPDKLLSPTHLAVLSSIITKPLLSVGGDWLAFNQTITSHALSSLYSLPLRDRKATQTQ